MIDKKHYAQILELSDPDDRRELTSGNDQYIDPRSAAEKAGIQVDGRTVKVKANTGDMIDVLVKIAFYSISPDPKYKRVAGPGDSAGIYNAFMVRGSSTKIKSAIYFTLKDFNNSEDLKKLKEQVDEAFNNYHETRKDRILATLEKRLHKNAHIVLRDLPSIIKYGNPQTVYDWFVKNGYDMKHFTPDYFKGYIKKYQAEGVIPRTWGITSAPDKWGHETGTSAEIDFPSKKIKVFGWSSDD